MLSSYAQVAWTVTAAPGTTIEQVILTGYEQHSADVPKGTVVDDRFGNPLIGGTPISWDVDAQSMATHAESITGYAFSSFHGCYNGNDFTLGQP